MDSSKKGRSKSKNIVQQLRQISIEYRTDFLSNINYLYFIFFNFWDFFIFQFSLKIDLYYRLTSAIFFFINSTLVK